MMNFKTFWKESLAGFIIKRVLLALLIVVVLAWVTLLLLDRYTHHGESVRVPDLQGLFVEEAQSLLANYALYPEVIDSVYVKDKPLGTIVEQVPPANSSVKKSLYLSDIEQSPGKYDTLTGCEMMFPPDRQMLY